MTSKRMQLKFLFVLALTAAGGLLTICQAYSVSQIGDVQIFSNETHFKCDRLFCPQDAVRCQVTKEKQENNSTLIRKNICYGKNNNILQQEAFAETVDPKAVISLNMNAFRNGFNSAIHSTITGNNIVNIGGVPSPEVQKELDLHFSNAQRITEDVQRQVENINKDIERNLQQIQQNLHNSFQNIF